MRRSIKNELLAGAATDLLKFVMTGGCGLVIFVLFVRVVVFNGESEMNLIREEVAELNPEALAADGLDGAIVGYGQQHPQQPVLIYDYDKCVEIFMKDGMSEEDAIEWMEFNVVGSYMGEGTPIFMKAAEREPTVVEHQNDDWDVTPYGERKHE